MKTRERSKSRGGGGEQDEREFLTIVEGRREEEAGRDNAPMRASVSIRIILIAQTWL